MGIIAWGKKTHPRTRWQQVRKTQRSIACRAVDFVCLTQYSPVLLLHFDQSWKSYMPWKKLLANVTGSIDEALRLRNEYLVTENTLIIPQPTTGECGDGAINCRGRLGGLDCAPRGSSITVRLHRCNTARKLSPQIRLPAKVQPGYRAVRIPYIYAD